VPVLFKVFVGVLSRPVDFRVVRLMYRLLLVVVYSLRLWIISILSRLRLLFLIIYSLRLRFVPIFLRLLRLLFFGTNVRKRGFLNIFVANNWRVLADLYHSCCLVHRLVSFVRATCKVKAGGSAVCLSAVRAPTLLVSLSTLSALLVSFSDFWPFFRLVNFVI